jgi:hypothetical protein
MDIKVGDKVTIEFEVIRMGDVDISARPIGADGVNFFYRRDFPTIVKTHTPKPVEIKVGQVWKSPCGQYERTVLYVDDVTVLYESSYDSMHRIVTTPTQFKKGTLFRDA